MFAKLLDLQYNFVKLFCSHNVFVGVIFKEDLVLYEEIIGQVGKYYKFNLVPSLYFRLNDVCGNLILCKVLNMI